MGNLALYLSSNGRLREAEELEVKPIETNKRVFGLEHMKTITSIGNLALTFQRQSRWKEAEELERQVLETRKRVAGLEASWHTDLHE
jgi:hypothetical protein